MKKFTALFLTAMLIMALFAGCSSGTETAPVRFPLGNTPKRPSL